MARFVISNSIVDTCVQTYTYLSASHILQRSWVIQERPAFVTARAISTSRSTAKVTTMVSHSFQEIYVYLSGQNAGAGQALTGPNSLCSRQSLAKKKCYQELRRNRIKVSICKYNCVSETCLKFDYVQHLNIGLKDKRVAIVIHVFSM